MDYIHFISSSLSKFFFPFKLFFGFFFSVLLLLISLLSFLLFFELLLVFLEPDSSDEDFPFFLLTLESAISEVSSSEEEDPEPETSDFELALSLNCSRVLSSSSAHSLFFPFYPSFLLITSFILANLSYSFLSFFFYLTWLASVRLVTLLVSHAISSYESLPGLNPNSL